MRGLFCGCTAKNNEEYKKVVKRRMWRMTLAGATGIAVAITAYVAFYYEISAISDHTLGVYTGVGSGLAFVAVVFLIRDFFLLRTEAKLKIRRLEQTDERLTHIRDLALKPALFALLLVLYAGCLIGSIFYPVLVYVLFITVWVFLIVYFIAYRIYEKKM